MTQDEKRKAANYRIVRYDGEYMIEVLDRAIGHWYVVAVHVKTLQEAVRLAEKYEEEPCVKMPDGKELLKACEEDLEKLKCKGLDEDPERYAYNAFLDGFGYGCHVRPSLTAADIKRIFEIEVEMQEEKTVEELAKLEEEGYYDEISRRYNDELEH